MGYVFRIHDAANANEQDWTPTSHIAGARLGSIKLSEANDKMGTSIPSIFARIFLFNNAFEVMKGKSLDDLRRINPNTTLISECLDLLEFLYQHGNDSKLTIRCWNAASQIAALRASNSPANHCRLADVLDSELHNYPLLENIYLIFWKCPDLKTGVEEEILIGGTSPYTMVFTSPNWGRSMLGKHLSFNRMDGSKMFADSIKSLPDRDSKFKKMIYSLYVAFQQQLVNQCSGLEKYLSTCWNGEVQDPRILAMDSTRFSNSYSVVADAGRAPVYAGKIPLCYEQIRPSNSGYMIRASVNHLPGTETPLVLNKNGIMGAPYVGDSEWKTDTCSINEAALRGQSLNERILPGQMGIKYPFLIWSDFLEDKILKLPYPLNNEQFVTACDGDSQYVLPLKKEFFNFFTINNIDMIVGPHNKRLVEVHPDTNKVVVTLNIPIVYHNSTIELSKTYLAGEIVPVNDLLLAFFPFYRIVNAPAGLNQYNIMACGNDLSLAFYDQANVFQAINAQSVVRTASGTAIHQTQYYKTSQEFDLVEVHASELTGLIIPRMRKIDVKKAGQTFSFAVDLGTSNTYIAYNSDQNPLPKTFEIDHTDLQTIYLNKPGAETGQDINSMKMFFPREFAPILLKKGEIASYPSITATCETRNFTNSQAYLFGNISIGYNIEHEAPSLNNQPLYSYKTDLKWALEKDPTDVHYRDRIKAYCQEILLLLKHKALLNDGTAAFTVFLTFPETMKVPTRGSIIQCWDWARKELGLNSLCTFRYGSDLSESIAPYNQLAPTVGGQSFLNIDIGGGTSDILFVNKVNGMIESAHYASTLFAANDLWGDGLSVGTNQKPQNKFYLHVMEHIETNKNNYPAELLAYLQTFSTLTNSSADIMGFLFKHEDKFDTGALIKNDPRLYSLIFIHYAALMYYVARLIKKLGIGIPAHFSFTGMGSRYINLISKESAVIQDFSKLLLEKYSGCKCPETFAIHDVAEPKEITAKGTLLGQSLNANYKIEASQLHEVFDYGFDTSNTLKYEDVDKPEIKNAILRSYMSFIYSLREPDVANYLHQKFNLIIPEEIFTRMENLANNSYTDVCSQINKAHNKLDIKDTLFFWPLKYALSKL